MGVPASGPEGTGFERTGFGESGPVRPGARRGPRCPACGVDGLRPMLWGLPADWAVPGLSDRVIVGGCVRGDDDAPRGCLSCGAEVWANRVFARGPGIRQRVIGGNEWTVHRDGGITITGDGVDLVLPPEGCDVLVFSLVLDHLDDVAAFRLWLQRRGLSAVGRMVGPVVRVGLTDRSLVVEGSEGALEVGAPARLVLGLVAHASGSRRRSMSQVVAWLEDGWDLVPAVLD